MNFNRHKNDQQKAGQPQHRRSIAEGMARTGIMINKMKSNLSFQLRTIGSVFYLPYLLILPVSRSFFLTPYVISNIW